MKKRDIFWFILLRVIIITSLIISALSIQFSTSEFLPLFPFYYLIVAAYLLSGLYLVLYLWGKYYGAQVGLQIFFDLLLITVLVYLSGGLRGSFYFLYIFEIIAASIVISTRAAFYTAAASSVFFGILVDGLYLGIIPYFGSDQPMELSLAFVLNNIFIAWGVFFLVAFLTNYLTESLKKTREQLALAQKELEIKKRLAMAGEFSAQLAHEVRNPLTAVSGSVQLLRDTLDLSKKEKQLMDIVVRESKRVSESIEQFLNLASSPGKQTFSLVNLTEVMKETLTLMKRSGVLDGKYHVTGNYISAGIRYYASKDQIKQIFWNLVKNGLKAMPEGGRLNIDFTKNNSDDLSLIFSDTGIGMNEEEKERLFEPFYSRFQDGSGIGMAVVRRIVDDYNGQIEVTSEPGKGTTLMIIFPGRG